MADEVIPFDGEPYLLLGKKVMGCHFGTDKHRKEKEQIMEQHQINSQVIHFLMKT